LPTQYAGAGIRTHAITPEHAEDVCLVRLPRNTQPALFEAAWRLAANLDLQAILDESQGARP
jgi:hypothetical protein